MPELPQTVLKALRSVEPSAEFSGHPPKVTSSTGNKFFVKVGSSSEVEQFNGEAESLKAIENAAPGLAPRLIEHGVSEDDGRPYFVSEYKEFAGGGLGGKADKLAMRLAEELHGHQSERGGKFGFEVPTFCGATRMRNGWFDTWEKCYDDKIEELLGYLRKKGGSYGALCEKGERVRKIVIPKLLGPLEIRPALLHGDLWSGNVGVDSEGNPIIFDPSSYYGHNEADLAIARIFGGFPESFYSTYFEHYPKAEPVDQFESRAHLYELFHYLNHTVLFGGGYASSAEQKMGILLKNVK